MLWGLWSVGFLRIRVFKKKVLYFWLLRLICLGNAEELLGDIPHFPTLPERLHFFSCKEQRVQKVGVRMSDHGGKTRKWLQAENGDITGTNIKGHVQAFTSASPYSFSSNIKYKQRCLKQHNHHRQLYNHGTLIMERAQVKVIKTVITNATLWLAMTFLSRGSALLIGHDEFCGGGSNPLHTLCRRSVEFSHINHTALGW